MNGYFPVALAAALVALPAFAAEPKPTTRAEQGFLNEAARGGLMEVELGRVATQNAATDRVKDFGQRMVDDHSKANDDLKGLASRENVTLPTAVSKDEQKQIDRLSKLHGAAFDKAYMQAMLQDHEKDVAKFRQESKTARDPDVKDFASRTLPTLEEHLRMAQSITGHSGRTTAGTRRHMD